MFHRLTARQPKVAGQRPGRGAVPPLPPLIPLVLWSAPADIRCCDHALVILSYTIRVAVNLEGDYGKSNQCSSAASCRAARSAVARREVRPSDFRDRVAKWFRNIPERKPTSPNYLGSLTTENGAGAKGEMGKDSERTAANSRCSQNNGLHSCEAYDLGGRPQEESRRPSGHAGRRLGPRRRRRLRASGANHSHRSA